MFMKKCSIRKILHSTFRTFKFIGNSGGSRILAQLNRIIVRHGGSWLRLKKFSEKINFSKFKKIHLDFNWIRFLCAFFVHHQMLIIVGELFEQRSTRVTVVSELHLTFTTAQGCRF